jgi:hypothetical protein
MDAQQFAAAYALATAIGLRAFITLALASAAMHLGYLHPSPSFAWLGSNGATAALGALAILEFASEKVPVLDHFMHAIHFATKPIAAAVLVGSLVPEDNGTIGAATYAMMGAGALDALGVHAASATVRTGSILTPVLAAVGAALITVAIVLIARRIYLMARRQRVAVRP